MPTYAQGNRWLTKITVPKDVDPRGRISRMTETKEAGEAWELAVKAAIKLGKPIPEPDGKAPTVGGRDAGTVQNALRSAETIRWGRLRKGGTGQIFNARKFVAWVGPNTSAREAFSEATIRRYCEHLIADRGLSNPTLSKHMYAIKVLMSFADVPKIELPRFKYRMEDRARQRAFTPTEERAVIDLLTTWSRERERDFFMFLIDTGLRPRQEAAKLTWKQVKADRLVNVVGKTGKLRDVPLTKRARLILARQPAGTEGPWSWYVEKTMSELWQKIVAKLPELDGESAKTKCVWYTCRHTFATRLVLSNQYTYGYIAKLMDNSVAMIEKVYGHLHQDDLSSVVAALDKYGEADLKVVGGTEMGDKAADKPVTNVTKR